MSYRILSERCASCRFSAPVDVGLESQMLRACIYILHTFEPRPCPAGEACTVFEPMPEPEAAHE